MTTSNIPLKVDLHGRVQNMRLAPSNALYALFEAVANSIHAILDGPQPDNGEITTRMLRDKGQPNLGQYDLRKFRLPAPPSGEKNGIAEWTETGFAWVNPFAYRTTAPTGVLREYRSSPIAATVTGKIDVREAVQNG